MKKNDVITSENEVYFSSIRNNILKGPYIESVGDIEIEEDPYDFDNSGVSNRTYW